MGDVSFEGAAVNLPENEAQRALAALQDEIELHRKVDRGRSYLDRGIDFIWRSDEKSLSRLEKLEGEVKEHIRSGAFASVSAMRDTIVDALKADRKAIGLQNEISFYGTTGLKVGALFLSGRAGWALTGGLFMADEAKVGDTAGRQFVDAGLGAAKGLAFKGLMTGVLKTDWHFALKGGAMSLGGRTIDTALTSENYYDKKSGGYNLWTGLVATGKEFVNAEHLATDALVMGAAYGAGLGLSKLIGPAFQASPLYSRMATSTVAGASRGAMMELSAARTAGESISLSRLGSRALMLGAVYGLASVPGGLQAEHALRQSADKTPDSQPDQQAQDLARQLHQYRKVGTVKAVRLTEPTEWTTAKGEVMRAEAGDWQITGPDGSIWSVKPDIFAQTYSAVPGSAGEFAKTAITRAMKLTEAVTIQTLEGEGSGAPGDYLVVGPKGEQYIVPGAKFEAMYKPVEPAR